ncbi:MAG: ferredoxin [Dehalococcoidia bacterium]|nr:ferredoxin [Dehalococcoidia bacterium]
MKVSVNHDLCEGHGKCEASAPAVFEVRDDDLSYVLVDDVPADQVDNVEKAIRLCPRAAIAWVQES